MILSWYKFNAKGRNGRPGETPIDWNNLDFSTCTAIAVQTPPEAVTAHEKWRRPVDNHGVHNKYYREQNRVLIKVSADQDVSHWKDKLSLNYSDGIAIDEFTDRNPNPTDPRTGEKPLFDPEKWYSKHGEAWLEKVRLARDAYPDKIIGAYMGGDFSTRKWAETKRILEWVGELRGYVDFLNAPNLLKEGATDFSGFRKRVELWTDLHPGINDKLLSGFALHSDRITGDEVSYTDFLKVQVDTILNERDKYLVSQCLGFSAWSPEEVSYKVLHAFNHMMSAYQNANVVRGKVTDIHPSPGPNRFLFKLHHHVTRAPRGRWFEIHSNENYLWFTVKRAKGLGKEVVVTTREPITAVKPARVETVSVI